MSVLAKGMEMPTSCSDCKIRLSVGCCGNLPQNTRMPNCPLVPAPPHGDLIDRDALMKAFKAEDWRNAYNKPPTGKRLNNCPLSEAEERD